MGHIPGWLTGLIILALVIALGWAAIIPRELTIGISSQNASSTTNYYNADVNHYHHATGDAPANTEEQEDDDSDGE